MAVATMQGVRMLVVAAGSSSPLEQEELRRQVLADLTPDVMVAEETLGAASMNDDTVAQMPGRLLRRLPRSLALALAVWQRRRDYDVVLTWGERIAFPVAALLALSPRRRMRHIAILMWPFDATSPSPLKRLVKQQLFPRIARHGMDRVCVPAPMQRRRLVERWGIPAVRTVPVRWPVDTRFWRPMDGAGDLICSVGREMRDYATLISALRGLDVPCHIAAGTSTLNAAFGTEDERAANFDGALPPGVTLGPKTPAELRELYARSAFVVVPILPTDSDNGVTTVAEAMAMGRAVIATDTAGKADLLQDGVTCVLVPPQDPEALRTAIAELWADPVRRARLGAAAREWVAAACSQDQWLDGMRATAAELARR